MFIINLMLLSVEVFISKMPTKVGTKMIEMISSVVGFLNQYLWSYILIGLLIGLGIYFTIGTRSLGHESRREEVHKAS